MKGLGQLDRQLDREQVCYYDIKSIEGIMLFVCLLSKLKLGLNKRYHY